VDKDNHLRDALKYILLSLPSPSEKPQSQERDEIIREAYATGNYARLACAWLNSTRKKRVNRRACPTSPMAEIIFPPKDFVLYSFWVWGNR